MREDSITLTVPARSDYAKTVRMTAAQLASRLGMTYDQVDDVRIAAEEAFVYACELVTEDAEVTFAFRVTETELDVTVGPLPACDDEAEASASEGYAGFILKSVCDEFSLVRGGGICHLRLACRLAPPTGDAGA